MDSRPHSRDNAARHEKSKSHLKSVKHRISQLRAEPSPSRDNHSIIERSAVAIDVLLEDMGSTGFEQMPEPGPSHWFDPATEPVDAEMEMGKALLAQALKGFMDDGDYSEDEAEDTRSEGERERLAELEEREEMIGMYLSVSFSHFY